LTEKVFVFRTKYKILLETYVKAQYLQLILNMNYVVKTYRSQRTYHRKYSCCWCSV